MAKFPLLLEPEQLALSLPLSTQVLVIEQASLDMYQAGHIPQSVWLDFKRLQASQGSPGFLPSLEALSALLVNSVLPLTRTSFAATAKAVAGRAL